MKFLRVTDVADVLKSTYLQLHKGGLLEKQASYSNSLTTRWITSGDKGGKSTKLVLQCLDASNSQSIHHTRILAFFEGMKDCHDPVEKVFGPIFDSLHNVVQHISELQLPSADSSAKITHASLVHGGDWLYLTALLGLTGPNGDCFCLKCFICLSDMKKVVPHSFSPHKRQTSPNSTAACPIDAVGRTLQGIRQDHADFVAAGSPKGKVAAFKNCEQSCPSTFLLA